MVTVGDVENESGRMRIVRGEMFGGMEKEV